MVGQWGGCGDEGVSAMRRKAPASAVRSSTGRPRSSLRVPTGPSAGPIPRCTRTLNASCPLRYAPCSARSGVRLVRGALFPDTLCRRVCHDTDARSPRQIVPLSRPMDDANAAVRVRQLSSRPRAPESRRVPGRGTILRRQQRRCGGRTTGHLVPTGRRTCATRGGEPKPFATHSGRRALTSAADAGVRVSTAPGRVTPGEGPSRWAAGSRVSAVAASTSSWRWPPCPRGGRSARTPHHPGR